MPRLICSVARVQNPSVLPSWEYDPLTRLRSKRSKRSSPTNKERNKATQADDSPPTGKRCVFRCLGLPKQDEIEMEAGAWAQRGLVPAWKGEVAHPGAPESQCVYKIRQFAGSCQCSLYEIGSNKPRYHKNSRADKEPQFLERTHTHAQAYTHVHTSQPNKRTRAPRRRVLELRTQHALPTKARLFFATTSQTSPPTYYYGFWTMIRAKADSLVFSCR
jgi:hypothetical protein